MIIEIEASGYLHLYINDETKLDQYGNDQTELVEAIKAEDAQQIGVHLDYWMSNLETDYDCTISADDIDEDTPGPEILRLHGMGW